jgi:predicted transcriptional regulator
MSDKITYAIKLDKAQTEALKEVAKGNDRTLSGEIRHALKLHIAKAKVKETR